MSDDLATFDLLDLEAVSGSDGRTDLRLVVTPRLCTPFGFLFGGTGIAVSAEASERATGRPLQWITTQFLGSPTTGDVIDLHVDVVAGGRMTTQTQVTGSVGGEPMFTSLCAHNVRPLDRHEDFATMPAVPGPDECSSFLEPFREQIVDLGESFLDVLERRVAAGTIRFVEEPSPEMTEGPIAMWCRLEGEPVGSPATQAFVADVGPIAVCARMGLPLGGTSLDNTLRVMDPAPTEWVLMDLHADGYRRSVGHSTVRLWSDDGRLLGIAQQSAIIRRSHHERSRDR